MAHFPFEICNFVSETGSDLKLEITCGRGHLVRELNNKSFHTLPRHVCSIQIVHSRHCTFPTGTTFPCGIEFAALRVLLCSCRQSGTFLHLMRSSFSGAIEVVIELVENIRNLFAEWLWIDPMFLVVGNLFGAAPLCLVNSIPHRVGDRVRIHVHFATDVSGSTSNCLYQGGTGSEETFFIGVENRHEGHFREIEALSEEINTD